METPPFIPPRPGPSPRASPRASAPVIPNHPPPIDPSHYAQAQTSRPGRTPFRYDGLPLQPDYGHAGYSAYPQQHSRSRSSSMYAPTPPMMRSSSNPLHPHGPAAPAPAGFWDAYGRPSPQQGHGEMLYPDVDTRRPRSYSRPQPPITTDFGQPPPGMRPRSHSRGVDESYLRRVPVPEQFAHLVGHDSPWYNIPGYEHAFAQAPARSPAGYGGYPEYPMPYGGYSARPRSRSTHRSERSTPWQGGGYDLPITPGGGPMDMLPEMYDDPYAPRVARPEKGKYGQIDTRWMCGRGYGPVLDPLHASILRASFKINPLLSPPPSDESNARSYLEWNMLFSSARAHRSDEHISRSWMKGRDAAATFPRLTSLRLISRKFAWFIDIVASDPTLGVSCGDVIDTLSDFFRNFTGEEDYSSRSKIEQNIIREAYWRNRGSADDDVPGGRLGSGMRRMDFLGMDTMWGGVEVNERYVKERLALHGNKRDASCIFVLKCERRLPLTVDEIRAERAREAASPGDSEED